MAFGEFRWSWAWVSVKLLLNVRGLEYFVSVEIALDSGCECLATGSSKTVIVQRPNRELHKKKGWRERQQAGGEWAGKSGCGGKRENGKKS